MQKLEKRWQKPSKGEVAALMIACYALVALGSIDIGRALYQTIH